MLSKNQILSFISKRTGINKAGFSLNYVDNIPRNETGKIQYSVLGQN